jgi:hypothetical protein
MAAPLRFEQEREGRIAPDIDALDRVHLEGNFESHGAPYRQSLVTSSCPDLIRASMPLRLNASRRQWHGLPGLRPPKGFGAEKRIGGFGPQAGQARQ